MIQESHLVADQLNSGPDGSLSTKSKAAAGKGTPRACTYGADCKSKKCAFSHPPSNPKDGKVEGNEDRAAREGKGNKGKGGKGKGGKGHGNTQADNGASRVDQEVSGSAQRHNVKPASSAKTATKDASKAASASGPTFTCTLQAAEVSATSELILSTPSTNASRSTKGAKKGARLQEEETESQGRTNDCKKGGKNREGKGEASEGGKGGKGERGKGRNTEKTKDSSSSDTGKGEASEGGKGGKGERGKGRKGKEVARAEGKGETQATDTRAEALADAKKLGEERRAKAAAEAAAREKTKAEALEALRKKSEAAGAGATEEAAKKEASDAAEKALELSKTEEAKAKGKAKREEAASKEQKLREEAAAAAVKRNAPNQPPSSPSTSSSPMDTSAHDNTPSAAMASMKLSDAPTPGRGTNGSAQSSGAEVANRIIGHSLGRDVNTHLKTVASASKNNSQAASAPVPPTPEPRKAQGGTEAASATTTRTIADAAPPPAAGPMKPPSDWSMKKTSKWGDDDSDSD